MTLSLALLKPSSHENWPEEFDGNLEINSYPICCCFNRKGSLLGVGCNDGHIIIYDFITRTVVKIIAAHAGNPVCSLDWSRNSHKLVSCSMDSSVTVWDAKSGGNLLRWRLPSPVVKVQFNPRNDRFILICPVKHAPVLLEITYPEKGQKVATVNHKILPIDSDSNIVASFDRRGEHIYTGDTRGRIIIFKCPKTFEDGENPTIVSSFRIPSNPSIREIEFGAHNKTLFLVNSSDRAIRIYDCNRALNAGPDGTCDEIRKILDNVAKTMWHKCCLSADPSASYICVGHQNRIQIYETETGSVMKIITGNEKGDWIVDLRLHPIRPIAVSVSNGRVSVWARPQIENWSAYAPEFQELEKNMEYEERESEFDLEDEDNMKKETDNIDMEDSEELEVDFVQPMPELLSSDDEDGKMTRDCLDFIPIVVDDPDIERIDTYFPDPTCVQPNDPQSIKDSDKKHSPQKSGTRRKTQGSSKRPRSGERSSGGKKVLRQ